MLNLILILIANLNLNHLPYEFLICFECEGFVYLITRLRVLHWEQYHICSCGASETPSSLAKTGDEERQSMKNHHLAFDEEDLEVFAVELFYSLDHNLYRYGTTLPKNSSRNFRTPTIPRSGLPTFGPDS